MGFMGHGTADMGIWIMDHGYWVDMTLVLVFGFFFSEFRTSIPPSFHLHANIVLIVFFGLPPTVITVECSFSNSHFLSTCFSYIFFFPVVSLLSFLNWAAHAQRT
jgi:hypothetical protein